MIRLPIERDDDELFVSAAEAVINGVAKTQRLHDVVVVRFAGAAT